jgi:hypothetical protein
VGDEVKDVDKTKVSTRFGLKGSLRVVDPTLWRTLLFLLSLSPLFLHAQAAPAHASPVSDTEVSSCVVKTPGNTITMEVVIHFPTKPPTDQMNLVIVFKDSRGISLPLANVHAIYIAEERYNVTARVGQQAMIGEYHLTEMQVAAPRAFTKPFHTEFKDATRNCIAIEQGIDQPSSTVPSGEIIQIGPPQ